MGGETMFGGLLPKMGFLWKKETDSSKSLGERHDIRIVMDENLRK